MVGRHGEDRIVGRAVDDHSHAFLARRELILGGTRLMSRKSITTPSKGSSDVRYGSGPIKDRSPSRPLTSRAATSRSSD